MATKTSNTTWLIVGIIAVVVIVAIVVLMNKRKATDATQTGNTVPDTGGMSSVSSYTLAELMKGQSLSYSGAKQGAGESNYAFIKRRSAEGWAF